MKFLACLLVSGFFAVAAPAAAAADFPAKPVSIVVPFAAGGTTDLITRLLGSEMSKVLGQTVITVNKAGGSGIIGAIEVANAKNDGHVLGMLPVGPLTTQPNLQRLQYGPESFDYVCLVYSNPQILIVRNDSQFKTAADLIEHAKKNPGKLNYGSTGVGSVPHLAMVALTKEAGIDLFHVPYKGESDELAAILGGHITMFVGHPTFLTSNPTALRGLALLAKTRLKEYPNLPTLAEQGGPALSFDVWGGLVVPKGTPAPVIAMLENACRIGTATDEFRKRLYALNTPVSYADSKSFSAFVTAEFERNGRLLRGSGIGKE
jgi:tripartite-type tricarboxylate transporter receptor subunit TctC